MTSDAAPVAAHHGSIPGHGGLERSLKSRHVAMISIGGIIGAGLFVGSSASIASVGPAIVVSYALAGAVIFLTMRMLGELAIANPEVGFFTDYARKYLGHGAGFLGGWLYWYFWISVVAVEALAGANILHGFIAAPVWVIGLVVLALLTAVNLMSARSYGEFEFWFSSIKVAAILAFIALMGAWLAGALGGAPSPIANLTRFGGFAPHGALSVVAGVATVIFALTGAEITTVAAVESREPARAIAGMSTTLTLRVVLFYIVSIFLIVWAVDWPSITPGTSPFVAGLLKVGVPGAALVMNFVVLTAVLSCLNSGLYVTSRVLFALAAHGDAPQGLVKLTGRKVPARAIIASSLFGFGAMIASRSSSTETVFTFLINASGVAMLFLYFLIGAAQVTARRRMTQSEVAGLKLKMWLFPALSMGTMAAILLILMAMAAQADLHSQLVTSLVLVAALMGIYALFRRGHSR